MAKKHRDYVNSSALGSYFGVGFNTPNEQIEIDLGLVEPVFDDEAKKRMALGNALEDSTLDYFEQILDIKITDRNDKYLRALDDKIMAKLDGMTIWDGERTVVECKISNAQSYKFTDSMNYILQCHAYMMATNTNQCLLLGLWQGRPIYKLIKRDEQIVKDITEVVEFVYDVLIGLEDFSNFPMHILESYCNTKELAPLEGVEQTEANDFLNLVTLKERKKSLETQIKEIEGRIKEKYDAGRYEDDYVKLSISEGKRKGGYDIDNLSIEHPEINFDKYRKPSSTYKMIRIKRAG